MKRYTPPPHLVERAKAIRRKRAERKLGRPMTEEAWQHHLRKARHQGGQDKEEQEMTIERWCHQCGQRVPLSKFTQTTTKSTQRRCDDCLKAPKEASQ